MKDSGLGIRHIKPFPLALAAPSRHLQTGATHTGDSSLKISSIFLGPSQKKIIFRILLFCKFLKISMGSTLKLAIVYSRRHPEEKKKCV